MIKYMKEVANVSLSESI